MHIIKDENGNLIPHGGHEEAHHHHDHDCDSTEGCGGCAHGGEQCKDETLALLAYMIQHNTQHAVEIDEMAAKMEKEGKADVAKQMRDGVTEFQKGNMYLNLALSLYKEHLKEA